jgi:hypothetical protein
MAGKFPGLFTNLDPHDVPAGGAVVQENCLSRKVGCLQVRHGIRNLETTGTSTVTADITAIFPVHSAAATGVVFMDSAGNVYVGTNPI